MNIQDNRWTKSGAGTSTEIQANFLQDGPMICKEYMKLVPKSRRPKKLEELNGGLRTAVNVKRWMMMKVRILIRIDPRGSGYTISKFLKVFEYLRIS